MPDLPCFRLTRHPDSSIQIVDGLTIHFCHLVIFYLPTVQSNIRTVCSNVGIEQSVESLQL